MSLHTNKKRIVAFSAISLTDIVLLLLIFFLLSSSFIVQPGIKVNLPEAATGAPDKAKQILITITAKNQVYLNQTLVAKSNLGAKLRQLLAKNKDKLVVIRSDKNVKLQDAVEVIDIAKLAGASKFMIATDPGV